MPRPTAIRVAADTLTALPAARSKPLRTHVELAPGVRATPAWQKFATATHGTWEVSWDVATGVPSRIYGSGLAVPGSSASPAIAEAAARQMLADHLALLAPGARASDFVLVSDHWDGAMRSIGFQQYAGGIRVLGGQVSFRFKRDRLFVIGSEALPNVVVPATTRKRLDRAALAQRATASVRTALALPAAPVSAPDADVIVPFVADAAVLGYRLAAPVTIDGRADGRYVAYVDPASADVLATRQLNSYATANVQFRGVDRYPGRGRVDRPAPRDHVTFGTATGAATDSIGNVEWSTTDTKVTLTVQGDLVSVVDKTAADAVPATIELAVATGGTVAWNATADIPTDAQVITYLAVNHVKEFVRANIDSALPMLDSAIVANTNLPQDCNAFFDGNAVNFFHASAMCENTGRIDDVIFHEFGHNLHTREIIKGVGDFDGAMSEGAADFLASSITGDSGMGRGFFFNDTALRELDPPDREWTYPADVGEIHATGRIYGGTFWDLRKAMIAKYGDADGAAVTLKLYLGTLRRATSIPTTLVEALATDDDDGDLSNGTPNECEIRAAWGRHGMRTASGTVDGPGSLASRFLQAQVQINLTGLATHCGGDVITNVVVSWFPGQDGTPASGMIEATPNAHGYAAAINLGLDGPTFYTSQIHFADNTSLLLADNRADHGYTSYQGPIVKLYCTSFDTDPFTEGWTTTTSTPGDSPWVWDVVPGTGATDPPAAYTGTHALVQGLGGDYPADAYSKVELPEVDVGKYSDVRLQYRRWLAVEDSHFDQAQITTNGARAWLNTSEGTGDNSAQHHIDKEWRFHDVALSGYFSGRKLKVAFDLKSDPGLQLGGWAIDDLCIVANRNSICGDGIRTATEECDDGAANADLPNQCRTYCRHATCGDSILDDGEECDDGATGSPTCTMKCALIPNDDAGCCSSSRGAPTALLSGLALGLAGLRRRRR